MVFEAEVSAALDVMQAHIEALNAKDETGIAATLHFPHYRLSGTDLKIWSEADSYFSDFRTRSGAHWARSSFDDIRVLQAAENKVHLDAEINRYDTNGVIINTFRSLWVITNEGNRWATKFRSSFAAK